MPISSRTTEERTRARKRLRAMMEQPVTLSRPVYFVPGWRDEFGQCWKRFEEWIPYVVANHRTHVSFIQFNDPGGGAMLPWEDFLDFGDDLAELVHADTDSTQCPVDFVCHSMGGLDTAAAIALLGEHPELPAGAIKVAHTVVTYDTPFLGFAAAANPLFKKFVQTGRNDPWVLLQLGAMEPGSKRIAELGRARDAFLGGLKAFWPRGADNYDGLLEVDHESAAFGDASDFSPSVRSRYRGYDTWSDTTHSGLANGVTHDLRAILETLEILTGAKG